MMYMFFFWIWENKDIIEVDDAAYIQQVAHSVVDICLEYS